MGYAMVSQLNAAAWELLIPIETCSLCKNSIYLYMVCSQPIIFWKDVLQARIPAGPSANS